MENEDLIREQMTDTRTSMTEKLEKLEEKVAGTVTGATGAVQDTVQTVKDTVSEAKDAVTETVDSVKETVSETVTAVKDTVEAVKDTVQETIGAVKDTVQNTVEAVKDTVKGGVDYVTDLLNIPKQTQRHPWIVMGASVASGFCLGKLLGGRASLPTTMSKASEALPAAPGGATSHNGGHRPRAASKGGAKGFIENLVGQFAPEVTQLKNMAINMAIRGLRDVLAKNLPEEWAPQVVGILDSAAAKLTGENPDDERERQEAEQAEADHGNGHESRHRVRSGQRQRGKFERP